MKETYYRCPECGDLTTESKILEGVEYGGSLGMCYCQFEDDRTLIPYEEISYEEYVAEKI